MPLPHRLLLPIALAVATVPAAAQRAPADSLPFHAGQWGLEGTVAGTTLGAGALRFLSPSSALALNVSGSYGSTTREQVSTTSNVASSQTSANRFLYATLGYRRYRPLGERVAGLASLGGLLRHAWSRTTSDGSPGAESVQSGWDYGAAADAGAQVLLTPRVALGGTYGLSVLRVTSDDHVRSPAGAVVDRARTRGWAVGLNAVTLAASVYF